MNLAREIHEQKHHLELAIELAQEIERDCADRTDMLSIVRRALAWNEVTKTRTLMWHFEELWFRKQMVAQ